MKTLSALQSPIFRFFLPSLTFVLGLACSFAWLRSDSLPQQEVRRSPNTALAGEQDGLDQVAHSPSDDASLRSSRINDLLAAHSHQRTPARLSPDQIATSQDGD